MVRHPLRESSRSLQPLPPEPGVFRATPIRNADEQFHSGLVKTGMTVMHCMVLYCRRYCFAAIFPVTAGLGGCATASDMQLAQSHMQLPVHILVMQAPMSVSPGRLQKVFAPDSKRALSLSDQPIARYVEHSREHALATMVTDLRKQQTLMIVTPPPEDKTLIGTIQAYQFDTPIPQNAADHVRAATGADAILRFNITDYGLTPKTWRSGYITFEVVSTLAIAAAIASAGTTVARDTAGAYLTQEAVEETAESYAGFRALDVVCRPVRIEAELIRLNPVKVVWKDSDTGLSDISLSRMTRKVGGAERDKQLDQATDDSVNDIVSDLSDALDKLASANQQRTSSLDRP